MKDKEEYIYIAVLVVVVLISLILPKVVTQIEEKKVFSQTYVIAKKLPTLNKNGEKLGLIDTIYSKYNNSQKYDVEVSDTNQNIKEILNMDNNSIIISDNAKVLNSIEKLIQQDIIQNSFLRDLMKNEVIIYRSWDYDNGEITYSKIKIFTNRDSFENAIATIEIENITNKIIAFTFEEKYVSVNNNNLEKYVKYLGLESIQDWKYDNNELISQSAHVKIIRTQNSEVISIRIVPLK